MNRQPGYRRGGARRANPTTKAHVKQKMTQKMSRPPRLHNKTKNNEQHSSTTISKKHDIACIRVIGHRKTSHQTCRTDLDALRATCTLWFSLFVEF